MNDEIEFCGVPRKRLLKIGTVETVDVDSDEAGNIKRNAFTLLPPRKGTCLECSVDHPHGDPHNQQSLYYQMAFHAKHGRFPTWSDAMSHCDPKVRAAWRTHLITVLRENNLPIPADLESTATDGRIDR